MALLIVGCGGGKPESTASGHGGEASAPEQAKGPHGGKLFEKDGFAVEVTIYEPEIPPQSRVYVFEDGEPIDPSKVTLVTELHRIDRVDTIHYTKQDDYLQGDIIVEEPHSFDVKLNASYNGKTYEWSYASYEGRTIISDAALKSTDVKIEKVSGATIAQKKVLNGRVTANAQKVIPLTARFPGVVKELKKFPGAKVEKGDVLAAIEANESLRTYDLIAPQSGEVLSVSAAVGEVVSSTQPIVTVGDLSSVWIDLVVSNNEAANLSVGQKVLVPISKDPDEKEHLEGKIIYVSSVADGDTQTRLARAEVNNSSRKLIPETYIQAKVVTEEKIVPVAIRAEALQKFRDWDVVFMKVGNNFEIAILELGEVDGDWIEVKSGLKPGTEYATVNSFVVKADVMKSGATHDH